MPAAQLQRKLVLDDKPSLVLSTVEMARQILPGHDEDDILCLIEEGFLLYAWNIGLSTRDDSRREIRIYPDCLTWYLRSGGKGQFPVTDSQVIAHLLSAPKADAPQKPFMPSTKLRLLLNCSATHVINLIEAKQISVVPGTTWGTGPNGAALITISSITAFLKSRRLT